MSQSSFRRFKFGPNIPGQSVSDAFLMDVGFLFFCLSLHIWFRLGAQCVLIGSKFGLKGMFFTTPYNKSYSRHFSADQHRVR